MNGGEKKVRDRVWSEAAFVTLSAYYRLQYGLVTPNSLHVETTPHQLTFRFALICSLLHQVCLLKGILSRLERSRKSRMVFEVIRRPEALPNVFTQVILLFVAVRGLDVHAVKDYGVDILSDACSTNS